MKILFLTTVNPSKQGDYLEMSILHGLRTVLGDNCVEFPRKRIMYGDFSQSPKDSLHGKGFTLLSKPIPDISNLSTDRSDINIKDFDVVLMGSGHIYGETFQLREDHPNIWYTDGHDLYGNAPVMIDYKGERIIGTQFPKNCFKRELVFSSDSVHQIHFGVPSHLIRPFNFNKKRLFQSTAPTDACFHENSAYKFNNEEDYYRDMSESWFGLTCKKGGWDCLRHYEILASGALLLFRDFDNRPYLHSLNGLPTISYNSKEQLEQIAHELVVDNKPTPLYMKLLAQQRQWLYAHGTTEAVAIHIINSIVNSVPQFKYKND